MNKMQEFYYNLEKKQYKISSVNLPIKNKYKDLLLKTCYRE
jgi:hypothetical protein